MIPDDFDDKVLILLIINKIQSSKVHQILIKPTLPMKGKRPVFILMTALMKE